MSEIGEYTLKIMKDASWYNGWLYKLIKPYLGQRILEVGCGIGNFTPLLSRNSFVYAIDVNSKYINLLKKSKFKKIRVGLGDVEKGEYFFKNEKFDSIVCLNVLEHIKKDLNALTNMKFLLKDGGNLILLVPAHHFLFSHFDKNLGHFRRYEKKELEIILNDIGLKINLFKYINWFGALGWFIFLKLSGSSKFPAKEVSIFNLVGRFFIWTEKYIQLPFGLSIFIVAEK